MANSQNATDPLAITRDTAQSLGNSSLDMRWALGALSAPITGNSFGTRSGVFPGGTSGSGVSNDLQAFAATGMQVTVNGGHYGVDRGSFAIYLGAFNGATTVAFGAANPTNPRVDYLVLRVRDPGVDVSVTESAKLVVLPGTPSAVPTEPTVQLTSGDMVIAAVTIRANTANIVAGDISDRRIFIAARGGINPKSAMDNTDGSYEGDYRDNLAANVLERWSGSAWQPVASPAAWTAFTPRLLSEGTGTDINIGGTGAQRTGKYQLLGKTLRFSYFFKWGTAPWNGGTGDIYSYLPTGMVASASQYSWWNTAHLWVNNSAFVGDFGGWSFIRGGSNIVKTSFMTNSQSDSNTRFYRICTTAGQPNTGIPRIFNPSGYPEGGELNISGQIEVD